MTANSLAFHEDPDQWTRYATSLAKKQAGSPEELEDAVQAGILRMMPALRRLRPDAAPVESRSYLRQFILRGIQEHFQRFRGTSGTDEESIEVEDVKTSMPAEDREHRSRLLAALQRLPNRHRAVLARVWWRGRTVQEIAREFGTNATMIETIHGAATDAVRRRLNHEPEPREAPTDGGIETRGRKRLMARRRDFRPEHFEDERFAELTSDHRLLYLGIKTLCDCAGLFEWRPIRIRAHVFRFGAPKIAVSKMLEDLEAAKVLRSYTVGDAVYGHVLGWDREETITGSEAERGPRFPHPEKADAT